MKDKESLYYFDSSDEEEPEKEEEYSKTKNLASLKPYLRSSYILTARGQDILGQEAIKQQYINSKKELKETLEIIPPTVNDYKANNKLLGRLLFSINSKSLERLITEDSQILDISSDEFSEVIQPTLANISSIASYTRESIENNSRGVFADRLEYYNSSIPEFLGKLLKMGAQNNKNINQLAVFLINGIRSDSIDLDQPLSKIMIQLQTLKETNFLRFDERLTFVGHATIRDLLQKINVEYVFDKAGSTLTKFIKHKESMFELDEEEVDYGLAKQDAFGVNQQEIENNKNAILSILGIVSEEKQNESYVNWLNSFNKMTLFMSHFFDESSDKLKLHQALVIADYFSEKNLHIADELIAYRESLLPVSFTPTDYFVAFKLSHRIIKAKLKTNAFLNKSELIHSARTIKDTQ